MGVVLLLLLPLGCGLTTEDTGTVSDAGSATGGEGGTNRGVQGGAAPTGEDAGAPNGASGSAGVEPAAAGAGGGQSISFRQCAAPDVQAYLVVDGITTITISYPTVSEALAAAWDYDTVVVCPGRHDLSQEGGTLIVERPVYLVAAPGAGDAVLDAGGSGDVVRVAVGLVEGGADVGIVGLTLTGSTDGRGLVVAPYESVTVRDSVITENGGGGVAVVDGGAVELDNTQVSNNVAAEGGGGIRADNGTVRLLNGTTVTGNRATESGGGISCFGYGSLTIQGSLISGNMTDRSGGGIVNNCALSIVGDSEITDNTAHSNGGGLADSGIDGVITDTTITGNHADYDGGGISCLESDGLELTRATVTENTAGQRGGGASVTGGTLRSSETDWGTPEVDDNSPADVSFMDSNYDYSGMVSFECEETTGCISL